MINKWFYFGGTSSINCNSLMDVFQKNDKIIIKNNNIIIGDNTLHTDNGTTLVHQYNLLVIVGLLSKDKNIYSITKFGKAFLKYSDESDKLTPNQLRILVYGCRSVRIDKHLYKKARYIEPFSQVERILELVYNHDLTDKNIKDEFYMFSFSLLSWQKDAVRNYYHNIIEDKNKKSNYIFNFLKNIDLIKKQENGIFTINDVIEEDLKTMSLDKNNGMPIQTIILGVPGTGKSYKIDNEILKNVNDYFFERVVFFNSYDYSDFVGSIQPREEKQQLIMKFIPGPFTRLLKKAMLDRTNQYYLVIEEINRGNAPAIFGDIFQLLDREDKIESSNFGYSKYKITNDLLANYIFGKDEKIFLPKNFHIIGTMNTSDQNIFPLDSAFKRRFDMHYLDIQENDNLNENFSIKGLTISLNDLIHSINYYIINVLNMPEDKQIGNYFIKDVNSIHKLLFYIFDDIEKINFSQYSILNENIKSKDKILSILGENHNDLEPLFSEDFIEKITRGAE